MKVTPAELDRAVECLLQGSGCDATATRSGMLSQSKAPLRVRPGMVAKENPTAQQKVVKRKDAAAVGMERLFGDLSASSSRAASNQCNSSFLKRGSRELEIKRPRTEDVMPRAPLEAGVRALERLFGGHVDQGSTMSGDSRSSSSIHHGTAATQLNPTGASAVCPDLRRG